MRSKQFTLTSVKPAGGMALSLTYADGLCVDVDLAGVVDRHATLSRLRDPKVFTAVRLGEHGASLIWDNDDDLELAANNLRARAIEQGGGVSHEFIWNWMARHDLTLETAAEALGISRRMLAYYRSGTKPVPRTVALACLGWEKVRKTGVLALAA